MKVKTYIFIDDSGDPGIRGSNTDFFIIAAVIIRNREDLSRVVEAIDSFRMKLGWSDLDEFKFSTTKKSVIKDLLRHIQPLSFTSCVAVVDKMKLLIHSKQEKKESLYYFTIKELLLKLKISDAMIIIDGVSHRHHTEKVRTYLRQSLKQANILNCQVRFADSRKTSGLQIADLIAGSVARSFDEKKTDKEDYLKLLDTKIEVIYKITP